jgi:peptide/nickel transport system substrate-binding protein
MTACRPVAVLIAGLLALVAVPAAAEYGEAPMLAAQVQGGQLAPVGERLPKVPLVLDFAAMGKQPGRYGGTLRMLMARAKDTRQMAVYGYARLVAYSPGTLEIEPDILERLDVEDGRIFTLRLREGHRWSDGAPFTAEDFRYWWEDVANDPQLSPAGPSTEMLVDGKPPVFEVLDRRTVRFTWGKPNPDFLPALAGASPLYIYRPSHYLKQFHAKHANKDHLDVKVTAAAQRNWSALHNKLDNLNRFDNPELPVLQPWRPMSEATANRFVFLRNPYFHRVDPAGNQLPYIDQVIFDAASTGLIPAKAGAGDSDLQARYLSFDDYTFLKQAESRSNYETYLWRTERGAHLALYPNLNARDLVWRALLRDVRFRRALSLAINRHEINQVIYYGLAIEANNTVLPESPLFRSEYQRRWTGFDLKQANALLDEMGLTKRDSRGVRLMPDGRPLEIVVETAGESSEQTDVLELIRDGWMSAGIKLFSKPIQRTVFRNRVFAGETTMSIWFGLENGLAAADNSPFELAPTDQALLQWPRWGQFYQTGGQAGEPIDMEGPRRLMDLYFEWRGARNKADRTRIWHEMLSIYTDGVFSIGLTCGVLQPVVVARTLYNVPEKGVYNWDPGAHFGIYRPDTFWFGPDRAKTASAATK